MFSSTSSALAVNLTGKSRGLVIFVGMNPGSTVITRKACLQARCHIPLRHIAEIPVAKGST